MKTFVLCELAYELKCNVENCIHYDPHAILWEPNELDPENPTPCTAEMYCSHHDKNVQCKTIMEN